MASKPHSMQRAFAAVRQVLAQGVRAMDELGWTHADIRAQSTLGEIERKYERLEEQYEDLKMRERANAQAFEDSEREVERLREEVLFLCSDEDDIRKGLREQYAALAQDRDEWKLRYEHLFGATEDEIYVRERVERERADGLQEQLEAVQHELTVADDSHKATADALAVEEDKVDELKEATERATVLAEKYGDAIVRISEALHHPTASDSGRINRAQIVIAGLDSNPASEPS